MRLFLLLCLLPSCFWAKTNDAGIEFLAGKRSEPDVVERKSGLMYKVLRKGDGKVHPGPTTPCLCHYSGTLIDGTTFDSSYDRGDPITFAPNQVIAGWTEAMQMMVEGDKWELYIPSELAYGDRGSPPKIGPGEALIFQMEILEIQGKDVVDKLTCDVETLEGCSDREKDFIERIETWNIQRKKFEIGRLTETMEKNKIKKRFSDDLLEWMRRRVHILKQRVTYQEEEDEPEL
ncbi:FKBP-type peptidyl-prolyl cis-trans isomerase FklB [Fistulifera solaris]|uniref:peptidylprolyl isomerase n=1 Tax=Fistulifera solaris TaxID=1519565 RepID=A0A1Z5K6C5_FISSO|nr:FKBP-type peptidyl-prolyl cis-trans isomerase FklB [Fistulifera solaris]|eukprot:GAX21745.1 FKBP-type peptidyl-prolyl cis-trans isomerase FklB [Fistulifera solaris]